MPNLTVNNLTANDLTLNSYIMKVSANSSKSVELTQAEMDDSVALLEAMTAASLISWSVAATTRTTDDPGEPVEMGMLSDNSLAAVGGVTVTVNGATISTKATTGAPAYVAQLAGDICINTFDGDMYICDGSAWNLVTHA